MITDRYTARVLGGVVLLMVLMVDIGCFMFTKAEISHRATFPLVVLIPSIPFMALGVYLLRKGSRLPVEPD